jgi:hypothetical protein
MSITPKKSFTSPKTPQSCSELGENSGGRFIPNRGSSDFVQILEKAEHIQYTPNLDPSQENQPGTFSDLV